MRAQVPVPVNGCYHSAFTPYYPAGGAYGHDDFESLAQKNLAIEMFYTGWPANRTPDFPGSQCDVIVQKGSVPHLTWEPWTNGFPYPLDGIITGTYDTYIIGYANAVKSWGKPLFIRLGHEMNGDWYPWGGKNNGGGTLNGFGDPAKADGPERFVATYRRVHRLFDSVGVKNVSWIWCPNNGSSLNEAWNQPENFYPDDDVVDWIGLDGYNWGTSQSWGAWGSFYDTFKDIHLSEMVTTAVEEHAQNTPVGFQVNPAYPNPFNGQVMIQYAAPEGTPVRVQIINVLGEEIRSATVFGKGSPAQFHWDATDARGRAIASGLYLALFRTPILTHTQKLLYVK